MAIFRLRPLSLRKNPRKFNDMTDQLEALKTGGPALTARPMEISRKKTRRRLFVDRLSRRLVTLGGMVIIASILAILLVIVAEFYPLFSAPNASLLSSPTGKLEASPLALGVDEYRQIAYVVTASGIEFFSPIDGRHLLVVTPSALQGARITTTSHLGRGPFGVGLSDGRVIP